MSAPIMVSCEGSGLVGHLFYSARTGETVMCQTCGGYFEARLTTDGHPNQVPLHDRADIIAMVERGDFG